MKTRTLSDRLLILIPFGLTGLALFRVWNAYPTIMQDEYIYLIQARHQAYEEFAFLNYLFSLVMKSTGYCGADFYACTKVTNSLMFAIGILFVYLIAQRFVSYYWAIFAASISALSPIALQISFFMPETMYFMTMTIVIWTVLKVKDAKNWLAWSAAGAALGFAALVKPHAIFILPAIALFSILIEFRKPTRSWVISLASGLSVVAAFIVTKLGVGYLFAGPAGLKLFGGYGNPLSVLSEIFSDEADTADIAAEGATSSSAVFLEVFPSHFIYHFGFMLLLAGVALFIGLNQVYKSLRNKTPLTDLESYFLLIFLISLVLLFVIPAFEAYVTTTGDDHRTRLILRYYEFLIPQFLIMALNIPKFSPPKLAYRIAQGGLIIAAGIWLAESYARNFDWKFADSSTLPGIAKTSSFLLVAIFIGFAVAYWIEKPKRGAQVLGIGAIPVILVLSLTLAQNTLIERRGTASPVEFAGWESRPFLEGVAGEDILIVGQLRPNVFAVKFWLDRAGIKDLIAVEGGTVTAEYLVDTKYVIMLGNYEVSEPNQELIAGSGFRLVKLN